MITFSPRASSIIFNFLKTNYNSGYYLIPLNACPVVPLTFLKAEVPFKLIDIEGENYCIDRDEIFKHLKRKSCKGLLFIYTYGLDYDFKSFFNDIKKYRPDFSIIEDKCLNIPSFNENDPPDYSDLILYSTGYGKYIDIGYGGFGYVNSLNYQKHFLEFDKNDLNKIYSLYKKYMAKNYRIRSANCDWLQNTPFKMEVDNYMFNINKSFNHLKDHKKRINSIYLENLPNHCILKVNEYPLYNWRFNILVENKEKILSDIFANGHFASSHYQPIDGVFDVKQKRKSNAEQLYSKVINLFNDENITEHQAKKITKIINNSL